jgi:hypothetical protein
MSTDTEVFLQTRRAFWRHYYETRMNGLDAPTVAAGVAEDLAEALATRLILTLEDRGHVLDLDQMDEVVAKVRAGMEVRIKPHLLHAITQCEADGVPVPGVEGSMDRALEQLVHTCEQEEES